MEIWLLCDGKSLQDAENRFAELFGELPSDVIYTSYPAEGNYTYGWCSGEDAFVADLESYLAIEPRKREWLIFDLGTDTTRHTLEEIVKSVTNYCAETYDMIPSSAFCTLINVDETWVNGIQLFGSGMKTDVNDYTAMFVEEVEEL